MARSCLVYILSSRNVGAVVGRRKERNMENLGMKGMDGAWQWRVDGTPWNILSPKFLISDENNPPSCRFPGAKAQVVQICDVIKVRASGRMRLVIFVKNI